MSYVNMFVSCVHSVAVLNAAFCMTYSLLMLVEDARGDHMEEAYSRIVLFSETIRNVFGCGCDFVAECYGCV